MASIITALAVFFVVVSVIAALRSDEETVTDFADAPTRLPNPGSRDIYAVSGTLGRAPVPSWG
jgi:hypothetical protein